MTPETMLDRARVSIERGELAVALPILIAQWREVRAPELGELIDRVDDRVNAVAFEGPSWLAATETADELERGRLLRAIPKNTLDDTAEMLEAATTWDDPRLTKILRDLLVGLPWTGRRARWLAANLPRDLPARRSAAAGVCMRVAADLDVGMTLEGALAAPGRKARN